MNKDKDIDKIVHKLKSSLVTYCGFAAYVSEKARSRESSDEKDLQDYCKIATSSSKTAKELINKLEDILF